MNEIRAANEAHMTKCFDLVYNTENVIMIYHCGHTPRSCNNCSHKLTQLSLPYRPSNVRNTLGYKEHNLAMITQCPV